MNGMNRLVWVMGAPAIVALWVSIGGCAEESGTRESGSTAPGVKSEAPNQPATSDTPKSTAPTTPAPGARPMPAKGTADALFVAMEVEGKKKWVGEDHVDLLSARGTKPLTIKVVNTLPAEHGFAIDELKIKEVVKPGDEITLTVPVDKLDPSVTGYRYYCQLHPAHGGGILTVVREGQTTGAGGVAPSKARPGETSGVITGETEGQKLIREQSLQQRETETQGQGPNASTPSSTEQPCEGFPGFDRGCPRGGK